MRIKKLLKLGTSLALSMILVANTVVMGLPKTVSAAEKTHTIDNTTLKYEVSDEIVTITGCTTSDTKLVIPDTIEGYDVVIIDELAFFECDTLKEVKLPNGLLRIETSAFEMCKGLETITFPSTLTSVGNNAFNGCNNLKTISLPGNLEKLGYGCFSGCKSLTTVTLPEKVLDVPESAFENCANLQSVAMGKYVKSIGENAFYGCGVLTTVSLPNSLTSIGNGAFANCKAMSKIDIPDEVIIGDYVFSGCSSLTSITASSNSTYYTTVDGALYDKTATELLICPAGKSTIYMPNIIKIIASDAFEGCDKITSLTLPDTVTSIGDNAFWGCTNLKEIVMPNTITSIGASAFLNCSSLEEINLPAGVTNVSIEMFAGCSSLEKLIVPTNCQLVYDSDGEVELTFNNLTVKYVDGGKITENLPRLKQYFPEITFDSFIYGDLDGDGNIVVADAVELKKHLAKVSVNIDLDAADVDGSGAVAVVDAVRLMQYLAGIKEPAMGK